RPTSQRAAQPRAGHAAERTNRGHLQLRWAAAAERPAHRRVSRAADAGIAHAAACHARIHPRRRKKAESPALDWRRRPAAGTAGHLLRPAAEEPLDGGRAAERQAAEGHPAVTAEA